MSPVREPADLGALDTEAVRAELADLDVLDVPDLVALMASESTRATDAVVAASDQIAKAVAAIAGRLAAGGRLIYVGAGTAGRLGVLDAAEAGPTFDVDAGSIIAVLAGGNDAFVRPTEGAEDDGDAGAAALEELACSNLDAVVGISASGRTPFVLGAVARARLVGALTVGVVSSRDSAIAQTAELTVELLVGGEVIAGSTRLNAATAQKVTLNVISTAVMVQLGKTYGNLMVDVRPTNEKLRDRAVRIVASVARISPDMATEALESCGWRTKVACVAAAAGLGAKEAAELLAASGGRLRAALEAAKADQPVAARQAVTRSGTARPLFCTTADSCPATWLWRTARWWRSASSLEPVGSPCPGSSICR
jgi:N-acetylmuramic acid 6-phosphate etherase